MEPVPDEGTGENLTGDGQGGGLPDPADRVEPGAHRIPGIQDRIQQEDARHCQIGQLEADGPDGGRHKDELDQEGGRQDPQRAPWPMEQTGGLVQGDEQEGTDDGRGRACHQGEEAGGRKDDGKTERFGLRAVSGWPEDFREQQVQDAHVQS